MQNLSEGTGLKMKLWWNMSSVSNSQSDCTLHCFTSAFFNLKGSYKFRQPLEIHVATRCPLLERGGNSCTSFTFSRYNFHIKHINRCLRLQAISKTTKTTKILKDTKSMTTFLESCGWHPSTSPAPAQPLTNIAGARTLISPLRWAFTRAITCHQHSPLGRVASETRAFQWACLQNRLKWWGNFQILHPTFMIQRAYKFTANWYGWEHPTVTRSMPSHLGSKFPNQGSSPSSL